MDEGLEKYRYWQEYLNVAETELKASLRMVDTILETVCSPDNILSSPELCSDIQDIADRLRFFLNSRLIALEDLIVILEKHGIKVFRTEEG
ncbi:MAG: hypothetical protein ACLQDF_00225 [Desulfomonilia bacterium]